MHFIGNRFWSCVIHVLHNGRVDCSIPIAGNDAFFDVRPT